ncbi:MAG: hypothetical protein ABWY25_02665 [Paenisporosarcina sp.]
MIVLAIDPGKTTGWAWISLVDKKINLGQFGTTRDTTLVELIPVIKESDIIVYEGWWTRPSYAKVGRFDFDTMITPQVIGSLLTICKTLEKKEPVKQQPAVKPVGYGMTGMKYVKGKAGTHWQDAMAHAVFYAVKNLGALPVSKPSLPT